MGGLNNAWRGTDGDVERCSGGGDGTTRGGAHEGTTGGGGDGRMGGEGGRETRGGREGTGGGGEGTGGRGREGGDERSDRGMGGGGGGAGRGEGGGRRRWTVGGRDRRPASREVAPSGPSDRGGGERHDGGRGDPRRMIRSLGSTMVPATGRDPGGRATSEGADRTTGSNDNEWRVWLSVCVVTRPESGTRRGGDARRGPHAHLPRGRHGLDESTGQTGKRVRTSPEGGEDGMVWCGHVTV